LGLLRGKGRVRCGSKGRGRGRGRGRGSAAAPHREHVWVAQLRQCGDLRGETHHLRRLARGLGWQRAHLFG
jgi:hypothetical protein